MHFNPQTHTLYTYTQPHSNEIQNKTKVNREVDRSSTEFRYNVNKSQVKALPRTAVHTDTSLQRAYSHFLKTQSKENCHFQLQ